MTYHNNIAMTDNAKFETFRMWNNFIRGIQNDHSFPTATLELLTQFTCHILIYMVFLETRAPKKSQKDAISIQNFILN